MRIPCKHRAFILALSLALPLIWTGCSSSGDANGEGKKFAKDLCLEQFKPLMKDMGRQIMSMDKSVKEGNFKEAGQGFLKTQRYALEMYLERLPRHEQDNLTSFRAHAKRLHTIAFQGFQYAEKKDLEKVKETYKTLKMRCNGCHEEYRFFQ